MIVAPSSRNDGGNVSARDVPPPRYGRFCTERVTISVPLELKGTAPGVTGGGVLDQPLHSLHIECLAIAIPESIRVNIGELQIGSVIHVKDVPLPADMKAMDPPDASAIRPRLQTIFDWIWKSADRR